VVGEGIVTWLWGGFSVSDPTLNRFFAALLLPIMIRRRGVCTSGRCTFPARQPDRHRDQIEAGRGPFLPARPIKDASRWSS
jgi:hypothetical protein